MGLRNSYHGKPTLLMPDVKGTKGNSSTGSLTDGNQTVMSQIYTKNIQNYKLADALDLSYLNMDQICSLCGIHRTTLFKIITGRHSPRRKLKISLCKALNKQDFSDLGFDNDYQ